MPDGRPTCAACAWACRPTCSARASSPACARRSSASLGAGRGAGRRDRSRRRCRTPRYALAGLLPDRAGRGLGQPGALRRRPLRPARGRARRHRARHVRAHARGRLRRRGQAPDHARHVRALGRLLRRLLRHGAEGAHAASGATSTRPSPTVDVLLSPTSPTVAFRIGERVDDPLRDVRVRRLHAAGEPRRPARHLDPVRPRATGCRSASSSSARRSPRTGSWRRRTRSSRRSASTRGPRRWRRAHERRDGWEPVIGLEIHVQLHTAYEDVLRAARTGFGGRAEHAHLPGLPGPPGHAAGRSTARPSTRRSRSGWRSTARSPTAASSTARTTSIPTPPRRTRSPSTTSRLRAGGHLRRRRRSRSGSRARTWRRTPPSSSTPAARAAASPAPSPRWSTSTAAARRCVEIVTEPDLRTPRAGGGVPRRCCRTRCDDRRLRLRHGEGVAALRRQRVGAAPPARPGSGTKTELKNMNSLPVPGRRHRRRDPRARSTLLESGGDGAPGDAALRPAGAGSCTPCAPRRRRTTTATSPSPTSSRSSRAPTRCAWLRDATAGAAGGADRPLPRGLRA